MTIKSSGDIYLSKDKNHESYAVWYYGEVYAVGGAKLCENIYRDLIKVSDNLSHGDVNKNTVA